MTESTKPSFTRSDLSLLQHEVCYQGFYRLSRLTLEHPKFEGDSSGAFVRELFERGDSAAVLLFDPERDKLLLVEQFRVGALGDETSPWLIECVAGIVEEGESPDEVVVREAREEAGCEVKQLEKIFSYWVSPGGSDERMHLYCGCIDSAGLGGIHGLDDEHEDIRVLVLSGDEAISLMGSQRIDNSLTLLAMQWFMMNRERLLSQWGSQ